MSFQLLWSDVSFSVLCSAFSWWGRHGWLFIVSKQTASQQLPILLLVYLSISLPHLMSVLNRPSLSQSGSESDRSIFQVGMQTVKRKEKNETRYSTADWTTVTSHYSRDLELEPGSLRPTVWRLHHLLTYLFSHRVVCCKGANVHLLPIRCHRYDE